MARQVTTESAEYQRLASLAVSKEDIDRKHALFAAFVEDLAARLLPTVKGGLEGEASSEIADEWIREATSALKTLAPELPPDLEQRADFRQAVEQTQKELTAEFCKDILKPSDAEIQREAVELAQCVLANWFSLLEHAVEDSVSEEALPLTANGIPINSSLDDLYLGVEAFAVSRRQMTLMFDEFLTSHFAIGDTFELAPQLFLARSSHREFSIATTEEAARSVLLLAAPPRRKSSELFKHIYDLLGSQAAAASDPSLSPQVQNYLAWAAARLACSANTDALARGASFGMDRFSRNTLADFANIDPDSVSNGLPANLASIALDDLESALGSSKWYRFVSWPRRQAIESSVKTEALAAVGARAVPSLRRIATVAAGYAVACKLSHNEFDQSENFMDGLEQLIENNPQAKAVLYVSAAAAQHAAAMPRALAICSRMSQQFDF